MIDCARRVLAEGGVKNLFLGWEATLLRDVPGSMAYFGLYEIIKRGLIAQQHKNKQSEDKRSKEKVSSSSLPTLAILFAGGTAGVANWLVAIPADTIKSRLQSANPGTYSGFYHAYQTIIGNLI